MFKRSVLFRRFYKYKDLSFDGIIEDYGRIVHDGVPTLNRTEAALPTMSRRLSDMLIVSGCSFNR